MNKKIKKAAAIVAASVLCMGMSMSAFAASVTDPVVPEDNTQVETPEEKEIPQLYYGQGTDKDGNKFTVASVGQVSEEVKEILSDEKAVVDIIEQAGYEVADDQKVVVIGAGEMELMQGTKVEMPEGGVDVTLNIGNTDAHDVGDIEDGDTLYVLHQKADGTWEVLEGTAEKEVYTYGMNDEYSFASYTLKFHLDSLSPVAVVKVMSNGEVVVLDKNEEIVGTIDPEEIQGNGEQATVEEGTASDEKTEGQAAEKEDKKDSVSEQKASSEKSSSVVKAASSTVKKSPKTGN